MIADATCATLRGKRLYFIHTNAAYLLGLRLPMLKALVDAGCEVTAFAPGLRPEQAAALQHHGITARILSLKAARMNPLLDAVDFIRMVRLFRREHPDIVFANNIKPVVYGMLAAALARVPERHALVGGLGYAFTRTPDGDGGGARRLAGWIARLLYAAAFRAAHSVIFHNRDDLAYMAARRICPAGRARVVPGSGVDITAYVPSEQAPRTSFVFVGRMLTDKGVRELMQAMRQLRRSHPQVNCVLVGDADHNPTAIGREEIEASVARGDVRWVGYIDDVRPYLHDASVFVLPSYREGLPRSTLEAMACGLPVVTTNAPGCRETVIDGRNGRLVDVGDVDGLTKAMRDLADDPALRAEMGRQSRLLVVERFSIQAVNSQIIAVIGKREWA